MALQTLHLDTVEQVEIIKPMTVWHDQSQAAELWFRMVFKI